MKIYTLYYSDAKMYNRSIVVLPNDEMAKKAMRVNLIDSNAERFRNEVKDGNVNLVALGTFDEEKGMVSFNTSVLICNLKDLLNDNNRDMESVESDKS